MLRYRHNFLIVLSSFYCGKGNLVALWDIESACFFKIAADRINFDPTFLMVHHAEYFLTKIKREDINVTFRCYNDERRCNAILILHFDDLEDIAWYTVHGLASDCHRMEFTRFNMAWWPFLSTIIKVEELAGGYCYSDGLLMVEAKDKADLIRNIA